MVSLEELIIIKILVFSIKKKNKGIIFINFNIQGLNNFRQLVQMCRLQIKFKFTPDSEKEASSLTEFE